MRWLRRLIFRRRHLARAEELWAELVARTPFPLTDDQHTAFVASHMRRLPR